MQNALTGMPPLEFANVVPLEQEARDHRITVDTPDTAPTEDEPGAPREKPAVTPPTKTVTLNAPGVPPPNR
jgi:hypothetical protein